ncbi:MAG: cytochrome c3 family protein, partial [Pseudomonadota bacterium]
LCLTCHTIKGWSGSSHRYSTATWNGSPPDPWPNTEYRDVALNACGNCHRPHSAPGKVWLLNAKREEDTCFACHNGNVASKNIKKEFEKPYRHPVQTKGNEHTPTEDLLWGQRHVQCADCHSPHGVNETSAKPPIAPGAIAQVGGISSSGSPVSPLKYEYELCYRCHADNPGSRAAIVTRNIFEKNIRLKFKSTNASYHPVEAIGQNRNVPSLILPLTTSSYIYCTDCHNSDAASSAGGTAPKGPHGSLWEGLLTRQLITRDSTQESPQSYSLCYTCHNRNSILSNQSFPLHRQHIVDRNAPCTACHDPHGVEKSKHLINFDTTIVSPNSKGQLQYVSAGMQTGTCSLKCHNKNHDREAYPLSSKSLLPAGSQHQEQRHNQALPRPQNKGRNR